jgi:Fic family protein
MTAKYLHQLLDWPRFTWNSEKLGGLPFDVRLRQGLLIGKMQAFGFSARQEVMLKALTEEVVKSSAIEGNVLNPASVRSSIARRLRLRVAGVSAKEDRNVEGVVQMMLDATQKYDQPLTTDRLFGWHAYLFSSVRTTGDKFRVGAWRDDSEGPMRVIAGPIGKEKVHYIAPAASEIEEQMSQFLDWFNSDAQPDPLIKAAIAHFWFVGIHPFEDGNGRIARAVAEMCLARSDKNAQRFYSMSAQILEERNEYYRVLEHAQKGTLDITEWVSWFLGCLNRAMEKAEGLTEEAIKKESFWRILGERGVTTNGRQKKVLNMLLSHFDGKLTTTKWAKITKCSQDTALLDIRALISGGVLEQEAAGGRSTSYRLVADSVKWKRKD